MPVNVALVRPAVTSNRPFPTLMTSSGGRSQRKGESTRRYSTTSCARFELHDCDSLRFSSSVFTKRFTCRSPFSRRVPRAKFFCAHGGRSVLHRLYFSQLVWYDGFKLTGGSEQSFYLTSLACM